MFKQSLKNILSLKKKYLVIVVSFILINSLYLSALNLFSGLNFKQDYKILNLRYLKSTTMTYKEISVYLFLTVIAFTFILIFIVTKYIIKLRAKEYSIYLIIAGVKKSKISAQIFFENIILFAFITIASFLTFIVISYPLNYLVISNVYGNDVKELTFFIQINIIKQYLLLSLSIWSLFSFLHYFNFKRLGVKQLMNASRTSEVKTNNMTYSFKDIIIVIIMGVIITWLIFMLTSTFKTGGGREGLSKMWMALIVGFIANIIIFKYLIKIIFVTLTNKQKKYDGLKKYYYSLIMSKSSSLSKLLGSTASVIVICASSIIVLSGMGRDNALIRSTLFFKQSVIDNKLKSSTNDNNFNKAYFSYKKDGNNFYITKENFEKFLLDYSTNSKKIDRLLEKNVVLHEGSNVNKQQGELKVSALDNNPSNTYRVNTYIINTIETMMGLNDKYLENMNMSIIDHRLKTNETWPKSQKLFETNKIFIVSKNKFANVKGKEDKVTTLFAKSEQAKTSYLKLIKKRGVYTRYGYNTRINDSNGSMKIVMYVIPFLAFIVQVTTLLFKFINSGWDNHKISNLFINLGFSKSKVNKIYLKETLTIFLLPLIIGVAETLVVGLTLAPQLLMILTNNNVIEISSLIFAISSVSIIFIGLSIITYYQYKSISFKK